MRCKVKAMTEQASTTEPDLTRLARRMAAEWAQIACQRLTEGLQKEAVYAAEWQRCMAQLAEGVDVGRIDFPAHRPAQVSP